MICIIILSIVGVSLQTECLNNANVQSFDEMFENYTFPPSEAIVLQISRLNGTYETNMQLLNKFERIEIKYCINCRDVYANLHTDHHVQVFVDGVNVFNVSYLFK